MNSSFLDFKLILTAHSETYLGFTFYFVCHIQCVIVLCFHCERVFVS